MIEITNEQKKLNDWVRATGHDVGKIKHLFSKNPTLLMRKSNRLEKTITDLSKLLGIEKQQTADLIIRQPHLFSLPFKTIKVRIGEIAKFFHTNPKTAKQMIVKAPNIVDMSTEKIAKSYNALRDILNYDEERLTEKVIKRPYVLQVNEQNLLDKLENLEKNLSIPRPTAQMMLRSTPELLSSDPKRIAQNIETFKSLGFSTADLVIHKKSLSIPNKSIKIRYVLASLTRGRASFLRYSITGEKKLYARIREYPNVGVHNYYCHEKDFNHATKKLSVDLIKRHPLTENAITELETEYKKRNLKPEIRFTNTEKDAIIKS
jgi:hypothetical protein